MRRYLFALCLLLQPAPALAQGATPILPSGDAAVAGFSGTMPGPAELPPAQRIDKTTIDLDGPALRVIRLDRPGGPPQLAAAPKPFTVRAAQIGQVFSLALDDASPPNIYAAASSAYGLPIVVPDADGDGRPDRARRGSPNAAFMPGLFGPVAANGGPGSIWKIDGRSGAVTLFANVALDGVPNSGPALGALAFDRASRHLFAADRDTGMIHRFTLDGVERGRFDHGTQGLQSVGLPPVDFDARNRLAIASPDFDSGDPATWAYAPPARRVFGLAVHGGRLYYAVAAGLRIWSVALMRDGAFGNDARVELTVPRGALAASEISEILFDDDGDMLLAERGAPTGAWDYQALAEAGEKRVLRFRPKRPDDPPSRELWFPVPNEYAIGFPPPYRNGNGGIAIGYGYDGNRNLNRAVCGGMLWSTGEQLRNARDAEVIRRLQAGGPLIVNGLQGNATRLTRPRNEPPFQSYFIDYDDRFDDPQTRGHLGDVVIWRVCGGAALPVLPPVCPAGWFNIGGICLAGLACPPGTEFADGCCLYRGCPPSYVRIKGQCVPPPLNCPAPELYLNGISPGRCEAPRCPPGLVPATGALPNGLGPPPGSGGGPRLCRSRTYCQCPDGRPPGKDGTCPEKPDRCGPHMVERSNECVCEPGYQSVVDGDGRLSCVEDGDKQPGKPNITVAKIAPANCTLQSEPPRIFRCEFTIRVSNDGTADHTGEVVVSDVVSTGRLVEVGSGNWSCAQASPLSVCRNPGGIRAGETQTFTAVVEIEAPPEGTRATNCVYNGEIVRRGSVPGLSRPRLASSEFPAGVLLRLAQEQSPGGGAPGTPGTGVPAPEPATPPQPPSAGQECASVDIPPVGSGPACPPGRIAVVQPSGPPRCCMPESVAAGTCGPPPTITCPPGSRDCPPRTADCPGGLPRIDGVCPQPVCVEGRACDVPLLPVDPGGGTTPACQPPKTLQDGVCACPAGTVGPDCRARTACEAGKHLQDGKCVPNKKKKRKVRRPAPKPSPTPSSTQQPPVIQLDIGIGIGGGGGGRRPPSRPTPPPPRPGSQG